ncbi:Nicastrin [Nymphaea thermarum]|nr:Nicastrin [Nymphaea thermarum]
MKAEGIPGVKGRAGAAARASAERDHSPRMRLRLARLFLLLPQPLESSSCRSLSHLPSAAASHALLMPLLHLTAASFPCFNPLVVYLALSLYSAFSFFLSLSRLLFLFVLTPLASRSFRPVHPDADAGPAAKFLTAIAFFLLSRPHSKDSLVKLLNKAGGNVCSSLAHVDGMELREEGVSIGAADVVFLLQQPLVRATVIRALIWEKTIASESKRERGIDHRRRWSGDGGSGLWCDSEEELRRREEMTGKSVERGRVSAGEMSSAGGGGIERVETSDFSSGWNSTRRSYHTNGVNFTTFDGDFVGRVEFHLPGSPLPPPTAASRVFLLPQPHASSFCRCLSRLAPAAASSYCCVAAASFPCFNPLVVSLALSLYSAFSFFLSLSRLLFLFVLTPLASRSFRPVHPDANAGPAAKFLTAIAFFLLPRPHSKDFLVKLLNKSIIPNALVNLDQGVEESFLESVPDLQNKMYMVVDGYPCVRLLNISGEIGCANPGRVKVVSPIVRFKNDMFKLVSPSAVLVPPDKMEDFFNKYCFLLEHTLAKQELVGEIKGEPPPTAAMATNASSVTDWPRHLKILALTYTLLGREF